MMNPEENKASENAAEDTSARDAARDSRARRARGKVIEYSEAVANGDTEVVEKMNAVMEAIDRAPDSFEAILTFGTPPLAELGKIGKEMMTVQGKFTAQVNIMGGAMDELENGMKGMNLDEFGKQASEALKGLQEGVGSGLRGLIKSLGGSNNKKNTKSESEQFIDAMQEALPDMLFEMIKLVEDIKETDKGISEVRKEAEKLGYARVEATRELGIYLGATKEVLRRYNEEYIPDAQKDFEESQDPEDEIYLKNLVKRKEDFVDRIQLLEGSRLYSITAAQQLRQILDTMEEQSKKAQEIIFNGQPEWQAMLAAASIAASSLKASQTLKRSDAFGDRMLDSTMEMIEKSHEMTLEGKARGTIDPAKLIEAASRMQLMIEKENTEREKRLRQLEATSIALRGASDRLIEAADNANNARLLEATEEAKDASSKPEAGTEPGNDNAKEHKPAPRKTRKPRP